MAIKRYRGDKKSRRSISLLTIAALCGFLYLLGVWQKSGSGKGDSIALEVMNNAENCNILSHLQIKIHQSNVFYNFQPQFFEPCDDKYVDYTPCHGQKIRGVVQFPRERNCPRGEYKLRCLVPPPKGYVEPFRWPKSRSFVPYVNAPYRSLTAGKMGENDVRKEGSVFIFPSGGAQSSYIEELASVIPMDNGTVRTALDIGCGVANWGAYMFEKNVITMSFAPRNSNEAHVKFALERGVPAIIGVLGTIKLPYPSSAFDIAHCSHCSIQWGENYGMYMMEVDRVLRPGGYWIISGPTINRRGNYHTWRRPRDKIEMEHEKIEEIAKNLCWEKKYEKGNISIWRKRINNKSCTKRNNRAIICNSSYTRNIWYKKMEACVTPDEVSGGEVKPFPERLNAVPPRVSGGNIPGVSADAFEEDSRKWRKNVNTYKIVNKIVSSGRYRNIMDMNAGLGSFAAALESPNLWVMNVVPTIAEKDTLGAIYERGLIGLYHDWCEAFSTYPRSYDLIHASGVFSLYSGKCNEQDILLEMDRILRPEGAVILRDHVDVLIRVKRIAVGMKWNVRMMDHEDGPLVSQKILFAVKKYWVAGVDNATSSSSSL
ncbi:hypothetical protein ABFX02_09G038300 [Erythranthe guttata]